MTETERIEINNIATSIMEGSIDWQDLFAGAKRIYDLTKNSGWTPCDKGLPKPEQAVIGRDYQKFFVTLRNPDGKRFIERCAYRCERWWMFDYQCYVDETPAIALAWMPYTTEPYNPDQKEDAK